MIRHPIRFVVVLMLLASLACSFSNASAPAHADGPPPPPLTPAVFLPPEWTPTPAFSMPALPPGWEEFQGERVNLWLPDSFEGGDVGSRLQEIVDLLNSQGGEFAQSAQIIEQNPDVFVVWVFDTQRGPSGFVTNVNVTREEVPSEVSPQQYIDAALALMPSGYEFTEQGVVNVANHEAGRLVMHTTVNGPRGSIVVTSLMYSIRDAGQFWNVTFATAADEYDQRLPIWEQSILTFNLDG